MAVLVPGVSDRRLSGKSTVPLDPRWITVHTMVGTLAGTEAWFSPPGRAYSHFGLGGDGEMRQWQDLRYRAASDLQGNRYSISIECEDHGPEFSRWSGSDVPRFTDAQADALVVALSWLCHRFGLPREAIRSSCPHERGIGWHRLGIDPWRRDGCLRFSSSDGKVCPGDRRIAQLTDEIIPRVSAPSTPVPEPEEYDMRIADCEGRPALLVGADGTQKLDGDQRDALIAVGVPAHLIEPDEWAALVSLGSRRVKRLHAALDAVIQVHGAVDDSALRQAFEAELRDHPAAGQQA